MSIRKERLRGAFPLVQSGDHWNSSRRARSSFHLALIAAALAMGAEVGSAATIMPEAGLDGVIRTDLRSGDRAPGPGWNLLAVPGEDTGAAGRSAEALAAGGEFLLAAVSGPEASSRSSGAPADRAGEDRAGRQAQAEMPEQDVPPEAGAPAHAESGAGRAGRPGADQGLFFPLMSFGGPSPCYWGHATYGAANYRDRCGYPAGAAERGNLPKPVWLAGTIGGGGSSASSGVQPETPGRPGGSVVQPAPIPVPPAWILLATAAAPLLLRRRRG